VLAIQRGASGIVAPAAEEILRSGDLLVLAGAREATDAAATLLTRAVSMTS
jgi:uncharacterized protein with PhoU and TrkA domain